MVSSNSSDNDDYEEASSDFISCAPQEVVDKANEVTENLYNKLKSHGLDANDAFFLLASFVGLAATPQFEKFVDSALASFEGMKKMTEGEGAAALKPDDHVDVERN